MNRLWLTLLVASAGFAQKPDPKELVIRSIANYDRDWKAGMHWAYTQTDVTHSDGTKEVDVSEVVPLEGTPYERLVSKDQRALSPEEQKKEDQKYEKALRLRQNESPEERAARIQKYENERAFLKEVPQAYQFTLAGEDVVNGRPAWVVQLTPRPDFEPTLPHASLLKHIDGKLWIDKQDIQWARAEADVRDTISIGWILARIGPGAHIRLDFTRVTDGFWMPKALDISGTAKVLIFHNKKLNEELTFAGYRPETGSHAAANPRRNTDGKSFR